MAENINLEQEDTEYHRAKLWQIILFSLNNSSTNIYLFAFGFVTYYSTGFIGLTALFVSQILGYIRIFDGVIDPAIGVLIDKTETKFGKYRPIIVLGQIITIISFILLFTTHTQSDFIKMPMFLLALIVHKIGYSLQATVTKAGQSALTSDPKQRPIFSMADGVFTVLVFTGGQIAVANWLTPLFGGFTLEFFQVFISGVIIISAIMAILAIIGIAGKDRKEYFGIGENTQETSLKEYWQVIKSNRPLQVLASAAALVKFNTQMIADQVVLMVIFGVIFGNFALSGTISLINVIPNLIITIGLSRLAQKKGLRFSYILSLSLSLIFLALIGFLIWTGQPGQLDFGVFNLFSIIFVIAFIGSRGFAAAPSGLVLTMTADISDYETSESGRYVSGMLSTIFSLTDSVASSFAPMVIGWVLAAIGYGAAYPTADTVLEPNLRLAGVIFMAVLPFIGTALALILMKFYKLDRATMEDIQTKITIMKRAKSEKKVLDIAEEVEVIDE